MIRSTEFHVGECVCCRPMSNVEIAQTSAPNLPLIYGQIECVGTETITIRRLEPCPASSDDIRVASIPHLRLLMLEPPIQLSLNEYQMELILVINVLHFHANHILYYDGMVGIFAIAYKLVEQAPQIQQEVNVLAAEFPYSHVATDVSAANANNDNSNSSDCNLAQALLSRDDRLYEQFAMRCEMVDVIQHALRTSRGRRTTSQVSLHCSIHCASDLFGYLHRQGCHVAKKDGTSRARKVLREQIIQPVKLAQRSLVASVMEPLVLSEYLGKIRCLL